MFSRLFAGVILVIVLYIMMIFLLPDLADQYGDKGFNTTIRDFKSRIESDTQTGVSLFDRAKNASRESFSGVYQTLSGVQHNINTTTEIIKTKTEQVQDAVSDVQGALNAIDKASESIQKLSNFSGNTSTSSLTP